MRASKGTIQLYIRQGASKDERLISWNPPAEIPQSDVLRMSYAIAYRSAKRTGTSRPRFGDPNDAESRKGPILPLQESLNQAQKALQVWLEGLGYQVEFR